MQSDAKFLDEREEITEYVRSLTEGEGLDEAAIRIGYEQFKTAKQAQEIENLAQAHGLEPEALATFVDSILQRMIFDGEQLTDLMAPLDLGWRERRERELALMADLVPLLIKKGSWPGDFGPQRIRAGWRIMTADVRSLREPTLRFPEFVGRRLPVVRLRDVTVEAKLRNGDKLSPASVMGVRKHDGIVPMQEGLAASNITRYKIVRPHWFAYNPMRLNIGSIARWNGDDDILVSPDYVVFFDVLTARTITPCRQIIWTSSASLSNGTHLSPKPATAVLG
ncbi:hypothetical protein QW131_10175 [Roseibium salinum]|nr:hypothetical protein [Roseibium salinum]